MLQILFKVKIHHVQKLNGLRLTIPRFIYLKIRRRDGVETLTILQEGELKVPFDGCISILYGFFFFLSAIKGKA